MSLRFYFGPSDRDNSKKLYEEIIARSMEQPKKNYLVIVPDQFTMQTQKELVTMHERGGIMNIDVLSFGRLSHRILEEVGHKEIPVLDDTGKSLVLQKVAATLKAQLPTLGGHLHKQGYIHEVKSAISEFMQYGISTEDVSGLIEFAAKRGALVHKLKDLQTLYQGFLDYIHGHFITTEETLDVLRRSLAKSGLIKGSVIVLDGFTGFTPIQNRLIQELMVQSEETIVSLTLGEEENPYRPDGEQKLFYLTKKTVADLEKLAEQAGVSRGRDVFVAYGAATKCLESAKVTGCDKSSMTALTHMQKNLFRYEYQVFEGAQEQIHLFETTTPKEEVHQTGLMIRRLIRKEGLAYRDIAVIMGDLEGYAPYVETEFGKLGIPCFLDRTRGLVLNPMIEYIKSALALFIKDFSYEAVFHYLRSGMADMDREDVDELENYVLETGLRGYRSYSRLFTRKTARMKDEEPLQRLNTLRQQMMEQVEVLHPAGKESAKNYVNRLYDFLVQNQVQLKLASYEHFFEEQGQLSKAKEYAQIYRLVMELLGQIYELLGEEEITLQEFADILEAGFGEIEVGTIPQNVDRVLVGDMERTRIKSVKVLFFLGVNDGNIPKNSKKGGIISDMDREFLKESQLQLAPSPRQQMFIQRFYLYLNMTKPSQRLYLSYAKMNSQGKSLRPAYLVDMVQKMFPALTIEYPQNSSGLVQMETPIEGLLYLSETLREYVCASSQVKEREFYTIYHAYGRDDLKETRRLLTDAAFQRYQESALSKEVAKAIYGQQLSNSVTRLETYAACAYRHFLQYGLTLKEREEFGFLRVDMGNVYHAVLEGFANKLKDSPYTWFDFPEEFGRQAVREALTGYAATYGNTVLYSSARNEYAITRMERILFRTVLTLQTQLKKGAFTPAHYEVSFQSARELDSIQIKLSKQEYMRLKGRIDRIDTAEDEEHIYVKVIDYKSEDRQFDLAAFYYGLQLQLVVYMNAAMELIGKEHPDKQVVPAAMLYYHVDDPTVEAPVELTQEEIQEKILEKLRMDGVVSSEPGIIDRLDKTMQDKSQVIPVERKKDGSLSARSSVLSPEELQVLSGYVNRKLENLGREIMDGKIALNPYEMGSKEACTYCEFKKVCGFDGNIAGYHKRKLSKLSKAEIFDKITMEENRGN